MRGQAFHLIRQKRFAYPVHLKENKAKQEKMMPLTIWIDADALPSVLKD